MFPLLCSDSLFQSYVSGVPIEEEALLIVACERIFQAWTVCVPANPLLECLNSMAMVLFTADDVLHTAWFSGSLRLALWI